MKLVQGYKKSMLVRVKEPGSYKKLLRCPRAKHDQSKTPTLFHAPIDCTPESSRARHNQDKPF